MRQTAVVGGPLVIRTASLLSVVLVTTMIAARLGDDDVAAHQIAFQLFLFLALCLDALAIAAQAMVGRFLGASDEHQARAAARRMIEWGVLVGIAFGIVLAVVDPWLVRVFTDDPDVRGLAIELLLVVAILQPLSGIVFVLDGVLIGAGDQRYLAWAMAVATLCVFGPALAFVILLDGGLLALWAALALWFVGRAVGVVGRYVGPHWQVTGASRR
jgi:putative MATE family efflux protein